MSLEKLAEYVFFKNYSQKKEDGSLETWEENIDRIYNMHIVFLKSKGLINNTILQDLEKAKELEKNKVILSSQRARQFASNDMNSGILKHNAKIYNCSSTLIDRVEVFSEIMYLLLCGTGVGYSLHKEHIDKLPKIEKVHIDENSLYFIDDSIEGWADAIKVLTEAIFYNKPIPTFIYSLIRKKNSLINNRFLAPGHEPLEKAINNIINLVKDVENRKLTSLELHRIICYIAESVLAGGIRRSSCIALFDKDDELMLNCKANFDWYEKNRELAMANNSILTIFGEELSYNDYKKFLDYSKKWGEPGFIKVENYNYTVNPCGEIVMNPTIDGKTGFSFCNLVEINAAKIKTEQEFFEACIYATLIATIQSLYTDFKYLSETTKLIAERDRAIGVSITGFMENPLLQGKILSSGATIVKNCNEYYAGLLNINPCKRCTTVKPSGNASSILELMAAGVHPAHDKKYLRRVRTTENSPEWEFLKNTPLAKFENNEYLISFPIETDKEVIIKDNISAIEHLKFIGMVKHFWVNKGCEKLKNSSNSDVIPNNVSCTVIVNEDEWDSVGAILYCNSHLFTGVSLLPKYNPFPNMPYSSILTKEEEEEFNSIKEYLSKNNINFIDIMSKKLLDEAASFSAIACNGNKCELI